MAFDGLNNYVPNHKVWDHAGNVLPDVEHSEGERPSVPFRPADWLPVQFFEKYQEVWYVVLPGKLVSLDNAGRVVPAQYGLGSATITYTQADVDAGVTDVRTGAPLLVANIGTFNVSAVSSFMGTGVAMAVSRPIGVAPYAYFQTCGGDGVNPAEFRQHNFNLQPTVAVLCDYVIQLPLVPASQAAASLTFGAPSGNVSTSAAVANLPVAKNVAGRTPITFSGGASATLFVTQVGTAAEVTSSGKWHIDLTTGVVKVYATSQPTSISIAYSHYASAPSTVSKFASAVGDLKPGDFVKCGTNSNFVVASVSDPFQDVMGQVIERESGYPKGGLDRVRTAFSPPIGTSGAGALPGFAGQLDQMSGSANGGYPALISYAGAADTIVRINLVSR